MDVPQRLLEIKVLIHLGRRHAHIAPRRQAPVRRLDLRAADHLAQARHGLHLGLGETLLQPGDLAVQIARSLQLLDGGLARGIQQLDLLGGAAAVEVVGRRFIGSQLLRQLRAAGRQLVEQVYLLDQAA